METGVKIASYDDQTTTNDYLKITILNFFENVQS